MECVLSAKPFYRKQSDSGIGRSYPCVLRGLETRKTRVSIYSLYYAGHLHQKFGSAENLGNNKYFLMNCCLWMLCSMLRALGLCGGT